VAAVSDKSLDSKALAGLAREAKEVVGPEVHYCEALATARAALQLRAGQWEAAATLCNWELGDGDLAQRGWQQEGARVQRHLSTSHWRWWLRAQAHYHAGELVACAEALQQGEAALGATANAGASPAPADAVVALPSGADLQAPLQHLARLQALKEEGNRAFQAGSHQAAVDKYSAAVAECGPGPYAAVLFCNRAAAHQSLGSTLEAVTDCGRARALAPGYVKAYTRLAALLHELRRPAAAADVYEALVARGSGTGAPFWRACAGPLERCCPTPCARAQSVRPPLGWDPRARARRLGRRRRRAGPAGGAERRGLRCATCRHSGRAAGVALQGRRRQVAGVLGDDGRAVQDARSGAHLQVGGRLGWAPSPAPPCAAGCLGLAGGSGALPPPVCPSTGPHPAKSQACTCLTCPHQQ
jgi:tetratricopeptide (TPR) repeat protein